MSRSNIATSSSKALSAIDRELAMRAWACEVVDTGTKKVFTWASGIKSPIYCDFRRLISDYELRRKVTEYFSTLGQGPLADADCIAGVATGGIPYGLMLANALKKPFIYVRAQSKGHGTQRAIEGAFKEGDKVIVVEDVCTTGGSIQKAVGHLRAAKLDVVGLLSVFSYGLKSLQTWLNKEALTLHSLSSFETLIDVGRENKRIDHSTHKQLSAFLSELNESAPALAD